MIKTPRTLSIALAAALCMLLVPAAASAEYLVPEGNSAVTQYTEGFPTAGGEKKTEGSGEKKSVTPAKTIGAKNAKKLEDHGPEGAAVAKVAAETAPADVNGTDSGGGSAQGEAPPAHHKGGDTGKSSGDAKKPAKHEPAKDGGKQDEGSGAAAPPTASGGGPSGSSGFGEVAGAAIGSSSAGQLGLLLPLVILAAIAWGLTYLWRQRRQPDPTATAKP